ncbi:MAG: hypothetical protein R2734_01640 [Nocardioides sp.]
MRAAAVAAAAAALLAACSTGSGIGEVPVPDPTASAAGSSPTAPLEDSATAPTERRAPHLQIKGRDRRARARLGRGLPA